MHVYDGTIQSDHQSDQRPPRVANEMTAHARMPADFDSPPWSRPALDTALAAITAYMAAYDAAVVVWRAAYRRTHDSSDETFSQAAARHAHNVRVTAIRDSAIPSRPDVGATWRVENGAIWIGYPDGHSHVARWAR